MAPAVSADSDLSPPHLLRPRMTQITAANRARGVARVRAFYELTKPGIAGYVMITAGVSAFVASRGSIDLALAVPTMVGTCLATGGALALNQFVEREVDARMVRTRGRPLPSGRLAPAEALVAAVALLVTGLLMLRQLAGPLPAAVAAFSALLYQGAYTPLKRHSYVATLIGAAPGALPMLIGWTAASGRVDAGAVALFAIGYLWQLPHVLGLAWMLKDDYARVGFKLIPQGGARAIGAHMVIATSALLSVVGAPTLLGYTGWIYLAGALVLSAGFLAVAIGAARNLTEEAARKVFLASLIYHPILLCLMLFDTVRI